MAEACWSDLLDKFARVLHPRLRHAAMERVTIFAKTGVLLQT